MATAVPPGPLEFAPPASYAFEPELQGPAPRAVAEVLRRGPYAAKRRDAPRKLFACAAVALLLDFVPGVDTLGLYFLPLAYLTWIGFGALALAPLVWLDSRLRPGRLRYASHGVPLVVRIVDLVMGPSLVVNGTPTQYAFTACVAFRHPETDVLATVQLRSEGFPTSQRGDYDTPFRVGDYVTALYLPGRFEKSLNLYAFLGLSPTACLRRRATTPASTWRIALGTLAVAALVLALFANVYAFGRYQPLDFDAQQVTVPAVLGAVFIGGTGLLAIWLQRRREQRRLRERNACAAPGEAVEIDVPFGGSGVHGWMVRILLPVGIPLLGAVTAVAWAWLANAWLDASPPRPQPARVTEMTMTTHALILREYTLTYALDGSEETQTLLSTPEQLMRFEGERAVAQVRAGRFGWPWVEAVLPAGT